MSPSIRGPDDYPAPPEDAAELARVQAVLEARILGSAASPARIGRFALLERLGAGGMGVVHAAYDEQLERRVAIKLLHGSPDTSSMRALLHEARAMARLSHPNVATIHEVGEHDGRPFVAMELLRGVTLRKWQRADKRTWQETVDVYVQAGRGLAAAHAASLVHRDFKPDNAMIDEDGTVKVLDFGLARSLFAPRDEPTLDGADANASGERDVTRSCALAGTPAYMSPEQLDGETADAASDQFAFCVALWEALFGQRPFAGKTVSELAIAVTEGRVTPLPAANVPSWLSSIVRRGLAREPAARWPSMTALLEALRRGRARARARVILRVGIACVLVVGAIAGWRALDRRARIDACEREGERIAEIWNDDARAGLREALASSDKPHAPATADRVLPWLDAHAGAWQAARTEACVAATVDHTWNASVLERSEWCLEDRQMELAALVAELSRSDGRGIDRAVQAASSLSPVQQCRDADVLTRLPGPTATDRAALAGSREALSRARAMHRTGAYADAVGLAREVLADVEQDAFPPFVAEVRLTLGHALERSGDFHHAERELEQAYFEAAHAGASDVAAGAAEQLAFLVGMNRARHDEGLRWSKLAEVAAASVPDPSHLREATHASNLAAVHMAKGEYETAKPHAEHALALREQALGSEHVEVAGSVNNLANVYEAMGALAEARSLHERALAIEERLLGPDHPHIARSLNNLANAVSSSGDRDTAEALHLRAIAIQEAALGSDHPELAGSLHNLAGVYWAKGEPARAIPLEQRALAIREKAFGPDHPEVAGALHGLAALHVATGKLAEAKPLYERALRIFETALGPEHPNVSKVLTNLGAIHDELGDLEEAQALYERALAIRERALGHEHPDTGKAMHNLGTLLSQRGAKAEAKAMLERALAVQGASLGPDHPDVVASETALAELAR